MFKSGMQSVALVQYLGFGVLQQNSMCFGFVLIHTQSVVQDMSRPKLILLQYWGGEGGRRRQNICW